MSAPSQQPDAELHAVEAALNTLILAKDEAALQKVLTRLLPPLLSALSTPSAAARAKLIQALHHINVRIRSHPQLTLPFHRVLSVATASDAALLTTNVALQGGYLTRCFDRLARSQQAAALEALLLAAERVQSPQNRDVLHFLAVRALTEAAALCAAHHSQALWKQLANCSHTAVDSFFSYCLLALRAKLNAPLPEASLLAIVRVTSEYAAFNNPSRAAAVFAHFLVAAGSASRTALVAAGEDAMKRVDTCDVLAAADPSIVTTLFDLFNDIHAEMALRIVLLGKGLLRVTLCANCFPEVFDVINHSLFTPGIPPRFYALGMQFVSFVVANCDDDVLIHNSAHFVSLMLKLVNNDTDGAPSFPDKLRAFGYTALSDLVLRVPSLIHDHSVSLQLFFAGSQSKSHPPEVRNAASHALITLARIVSVEPHDASPFRKELISTLKRTLADHHHTSVAARSAAVHWANECFSFSDADARLINIIASSDNNARVTQLASIGLKPRKLSRQPTIAERHKAAPSTTAVYPHFCQIVSVYNKHCEQHQLSNKSVAAYLQFSLTCMMYQLSPRRRIQLLPAHDIDHFLKRDQAALNALNSMLTTAQQVLLHSDATQIHNLQTAALCIVLLASKTQSLRKQIADAFGHKLDSLFKLITRKSALGDVTVARAVSMLVGVCSNVLSTPDLEPLISRFGSELEPNVSGVASGRQGEDERVARIMTTSQIICAAARCIDVPCEEADNTMISQTTARISKRIMLPIESSDVVRMAACTALADIGAIRQLPLSLPSRERILSTLTGILKLSSSPSKVVQAASNALGNICVGEPRTSFQQKASEGLLHVCRERKEEDIRFTAAECLVRCISAMDVPSPSALEDANAYDSKSTDAANSSELQSITEIREHGYSVRNRIHDVSDQGQTSLLPETIKAIMSLAFDERPNARAGGCVCLFTFLKLLADKSGSEKYTFATSADEARFKQEQEVLLGLLPEIQRAFIVLLSDRSDFTQQMASCGIALVYNICPQEDQQDLVGNLVRSLTSTKRAAATVPGDQGVLLEFNGVDVQSNSAGARSATYKELCSLAQDMGQPELVYKFMDLAGHAALWNSRKGAALAGSALLNNEIAAEQLRPHVKSLLPRLYVYCHDPTESVRVAMGSIISAVVKASGHGSVADAIKANLSAVTDHCLKSIVSRQWRSREAGCAALRDVLVSRTWEEVKDSLKDFWYYALRAMDDIKESVRKSAQGTGRALSELSIHLCNPGYVGEENSAQAVDVVLSVLMTSFTHSADEVRALVSKTLSEIIRHGGTALRSSVPDLIANLLEAATELEPQILNYAEYHVASPEELQNARVTAASMSSSSLIDSLERLIGQVDETIAAEVVSNLARLARIGVGIPTRAATARLMASILQSRAVVMEPYAAKLLFPAAGAAGMERNSMLRKAWCNAAGRAAKLCSVEEVGKYCQQIAKKAASEDPRDRALASSLAAGLWRMAPDTAHQHASSILPLAYMGRRETDDDAGDASKNWKDVWNEGAPSTQAGLRLYAKEIVEICEQRLSTSAQYRVKRSAAATIGDLGDASNDAIDVEYLSRSAKALLAVLPGHIWEGQHEAIEAIGSLAKSSSNPMLWDACGGGTVVVQALLTESQRGKKEYRIAAIDAAGKVLVNTRDTVSMYEEVRGQLSELVSPSMSDMNASAPNISRMVWETGSDADAVDARNKARKAQKSLCKAAIQCLESSITAKAGEKLFEYVQDLLCVFEELMQNDWDIRLSVLQAVESLAERHSKGELHFGNSEERRDTLTKRMITISKDGIHEPKYNVLRKSGLSILDHFSRAVKDPQAMKAVVGEETLSQIRKSRNEDAEPGVRSVAIRLCTAFGIS
eukprot:TRINITY_DN250_c0_g1_i1.p1 TRINITY_DN250_c0_g1~~TRINITY_DN250_c0_g1_i1.p1  ORF type:complete len:1859 (-),score=355.96 TRINITY_DN250_c0_g1_i1:11878-17454(-)